VVRSVDLQQQAGRTRGQAGHSDAEGN